MPLRILVGIALALCLSLVASAQSEVDEAEDAVEDAEAERARSLQIVAEETAERNQLEDDLFDSIEQTNQAVRELADAEADLDRVAESMSYLTAQTDGTIDQIRSQAVSAYMDAVGSPGSLIFTTSTGEDAMVVGPVLDQAKRDTVADLSSLTVAQQQLDGLSDRFSEHRAEVDLRRQNLEQANQNLESLLQQANVEVATAFQQAQTAEENYQNSLDELDQARAREEERRRQEEERRRQEEERQRLLAEQRRLAEERRRQEEARQQQQESGQNPTVASPSGSGSGTSSDSFKPGVERWRSTVALYFPDRLVNEALHIITCESSGNPQARNAYSGASGLFQFIPSTWAVASVRAGIPGQSVFDGEANIIAAAWLVGYYENRGSYSWQAWSCDPW